MSDPATPHSSPQGAPSPQGGYQQQPPPGGFPQGGYQQQPPPGGYPQGGYPQQPPQPYPAASKVGQPAELLDRFLARLIDYVILFAVSMVVVSFLVVSVLMGSAGGMFGVGGGAGFLVGLVSSVLIAAIYLGYFAYLESSRGQTVGKMLLKLETRGQGGGRPTMEEAVKRNLWVALGLLGVIPLIGGILAGLAQLAAVILIAVGINGDAIGRRGWHDQFAGTQVIKVG